MSGRASLGGQDTWNFEGEVAWEFEAAMEAMAGSRPVLAAMAFTHIGVTGLLAIYRAR